MGTKADFNRMFSRGVFLRPLLVFLTVKEAFLLGKRVIFVSTNVKTTLNLDKKAENLNKIAYFSS